MSAVVNLSNLREMTDGDRDLESTLFQEFFTSCEALIEQLKLSLATNNSENWRKAAHALKGASYNLGAQQLGDYCKQAQEEHMAAAPKKTEYLKAITEAYAIVKSELQKECH